MLERELAFRLRSRGEIDDLARESDEDPTRLLQAIKEAGGLWVGTGKWFHGELGTVIDGIEPVDYKGRKWSKRRLRMDDPTKHYTIRGVRGVVNEGGVDPIEMLKRLQQDGVSFAWIEGPDQLIEAVLHAQRQKEPGVANLLPGVAELAALDVHLDEKWWQDARWSEDPALSDDQADAAPADQAQDQATEDQATADETDVDDDSFNPDEYEQAVRPGALPHGVTVESNDEDGEHRIRLPMGEGDVMGSLGYINLQEPGKSVGDVGGHDLPPGFLYVLEIEVRPDARRQGNARKLYEAAVAFAKSRGYEGLSSRWDARNEQSDAVWTAMERDGDVQRDAVDGYDLLTHTGGEYFQTRELTAVEVQAIALYRERGAGQSLVRLARAMMDAGIPLPSKTAAEKRASNRAVDELMAHAEPDRVKSQYRAAPGH